MRIIQTWIYVSLLVTSGRYLWYDCKIDIYTIHIYICLIMLSQFNLNRKLLQGFFYSNRVINDSFKFFYVMWICLCGLLTTVRKDNSVQEFWTYCIKSKYRKKMKIGIICRVYLVQAEYVYVIFTTLADAKICFVFAKRQIAQPNE